MQAQVQAQAALAWPEAVLEDVVVVPKDRPQPLEPSPAAAATVQQRLLQMQWLHRLQQIQQMQQQQR